MRLFLIFCLPRYYEQNPAAFGADNGSIVLAGLGIGLLATAAVSLARTVADLVTTGAQVIRQAFRLGILVDEVSQNLQPRDLTNPGTPNTWAYVLPEVSADVVQHELDSIHEKEVCPRGMLEILVTKIMASRKLQKLAESSSVLSVQRQSRSAVHHQDCKLCSVRLSFFTITNL